MSFFAKISTKEHYGLRLALRLAETYYTRESVSLKDISEKENISAKYLEQLIIPIKKKRWISGTRGRDGGYVMVKDPGELTLKDLITALDEDTAVVECLCKNGKRCKYFRQCESKKAWQKIQDAINNTMESMTFSELLNIEP